MKIIRFSRPPTLLVHLRPKFFHLVDLGHPISNDSPSSLPISNESLLSALSWLYNLKCAVVQNYHKMSFIYNYSHFQYSFCNQPVLLAQLENVNKLWKSNHTLNVNE